MSHKPWLGTDQSNTATSAKGSANPPKLLDPIRSGIAELAQCRERVQGQMNILAQQQAKLEWQAGKARQVGREDLAQEALRRAQAVRLQLSDLATHHNSLKADEQRLIEEAQLRALDPGNAWRVDAETMVCALLPHVRGTWPNESSSGGWAVQPPLGGITSVRAEALGPGYMICLGSMQAPGEAARGEGTLAGMFGQMLGAAAVNYLESRKLAAPIAAFRHYGRAGEPVYFGLSNKQAREFPPEQILYIRRGQRHGFCPQHSTEAILEMAAALRSFMTHLWAHVGGSNLGHLSTTKLTINEADFIASVTGDVPANILPDLGRIAEQAGLVGFRRYDSGVVETGLTPAGAIWYLANQRLASDELIGDAMPKQNFTVRAGDHSVVQMGSQGCSANVGGDHYTSGTAGAQGPGSKATVAFSWLTSDSSLEDLRLQLKELRMVLRERAQEPQDDISVGAMGEAELAAAEGDEKRLMHALSKAGRWALAAAQEVGLQVAAAALAKATGAG